MAQEAQVAINVRSLLGPKIYHEYVLNHRPDTEPGFREDFQNTRGHNVRERVALRFELLVLRHTAILRMFLSEVERRFYLKRETRTPAPTTVAMVVVNAIISVNKIKLARLLEWY